MLSSISLVVAGLSTGHKVGLAAVGAAFILYALVSAFVLPRRVPNFPGRHLPLYATVSVLFFVAMLAAVLVFGKEKKEAAAASAPPTTTAASTTTSTTPAAPTTTAAATTTTAPAPGGNPAAGKAVFTSAGCTGCHTLKDAGATGTVGPNLDQLKPSAAIVQHQVEVGGGAMPAFKGQLTDTQIADVAAYVASVAGQ